MKVACENPRHEGDPLVEKRDVRELRLEWRQLAPLQGRSRTKMIRRECAPCMNRDLDDPRATIQEVLL